MKARSGFTLIEMLVVIAIISVLFGLLLPAVQKVRAAASRVQCANNLKQMGLALHGYHDARGGFPPGFVSSTTTPEDGEHSAFSLMLPFIEGDVIYSRFDFTRPWYDPVNFLAASQVVPVYFCPSNRHVGVIQLGAISAAFNDVLPAYVGSCDYALSRGSNASWYRDIERAPFSTRGVFYIRPTINHHGPRLLDITDGTSNTFAIGEATGGNIRFLARDPNNPTQPSIDVTTGQPAIIDQSWSAASVADPPRPWYGSVFAVTAQYGLGPNPRDEPMNPRLVAPSYWGNDTVGDNANGLDQISGFRSLHQGGCNFLFCDGSVRFVLESIRPDIYRALSTYGGAEILSGADY
jgi:prepilin-type N-terminal cleavage/methylation domain-containing protein/prepilin-type processing-associated H-X9-DG protein